MNLDPFLCTRTSARAHDTQLRFDAQHRKSLAVDAQLRQVLLARTK